MRCPRCGSVRKWYLYTEVNGKAIFCCKNCRNVYDEDGRLLDQNSLKPGKRCPRCNLPKDIEDERG
jgi:DNA-directed RNA polymerase subunit RPC12/RpoP